MSSSAELPPSPRSSFQPSPHAAGKGLLGPRWMAAGVWCLALVSLGASLMFMDRWARPPRPAYALDRDWATHSPLGIDPRAEAALPGAQVAAVRCTTCGRVEAVLRLPSSVPGRDTGQKPVFEIKVRMQDGATQTVHMGRRLALGTQVMLERGVLRVPKA